MDPEEEKKEGEDLIDLEKLTTLLTKLNDLREKSGDLTDEEIEKVAELAEGNETILQHLVDIIKNKKELRELADEILTIALQSTDQTSLDLALYKSVKSELEKQIALTIKSSKLSKQDLSSKQEGLRILTKSAKTASISIAAIDADLAKLGTLDDLLQIDGGNLNKKAQQLAKGLGLDELVDPAAGLSEGMREVVALRQDGLRTLKAEIKETALHRGVLQGTIDEIDNMYTKYAAVANLIPVIGPSLAKTLAKINVVATQAATAAYNTFQQTKSPLQAVQAAANQLVKGLGRTTVIVGGIVIGLLAAYKILRNINSTVKSISIETGLSSEQAYKTYKNALQAQTAFSNQLSTLRDIVSVQQALTNAMGRPINLDPEILGQISDISKTLGYSTQVAGQLQSVFQELGANPAMAGNMQMIVGELAKANELAPGIIAKDLVDNANFVATAFAGYPIDAAKTAIEVRKLGYGLRQASNIMDHLFDVQGSLTAGMEASVALNRFVDLSKARQLALDGDIAGMMKEVANQAGSYSKFTGMTTAQRIILSQALGVEVGELQRSLYIQENLNDLSKEEQALALKHLSTLENVESLSKGQLKAELANIQATERFNVILDKIKNSLLKAILPIAEALLPIFEIIGSLLQLILILLKIMTPILKLIGILIEGIFKPIQWGIGLLDKLLEKVEDFFSGFKIGGDGLREDLVNIIGVISGIGIALWGLNKIGFSGLIGKLGGVFTALSPKKLAKGLGSVIKSMTPGTIAGGMGKVKESVVGKMYKGGQFLPGGQGRAPAGGQRVGGLLNTIKEKGSSIIGTAREKGGNVLKTAKEKVSKITGTSQSIPQQVTDQASKASEPIKPKAGVGARTFLSNLAEGLKQMGNSKVFKGIAATALVGPALVLFLPAIPGLLIMAGVGAAGPLIIAGFKALSTGLGTLGSNLANVAKGSVALAIVGASLIPFTFAMGLLKDIDSKKVLETVLAVGLIGGLATLLGSAASLLLLGSLGIAALGLALIPFSYAVKQMDGSNMFKIAAGLALLGLTAAGLSLLAPAIFAGSLAIMALGTALGVVGILLKPLSKVFEKAGVGMLNFGDGLIKVKENIGAIKSSDFKEIVDGIGQINDALSKLDVSKLELLNNIKSPATPKLINSEEISVTKIGSQIPPPLPILQQYAPTIQPPAPISQQYIAEPQIKQSIAEAPVVKEISTTTTNNNITENETITTSGGATGQQDNAKLIMLMDKLNRTMDMVLRSPATIQFKFDSGVIKEIEGVIRRDL